MKTQKETKVIKLVYHVNHARKTFLVSKVYAEFMHASKMHSCPEQHPEYCLENSIRNKSAKHYVIHCKSYVIRGAEHSWSHDRTTPQVISSFLPPYLNEI